MYILNATSLVNTVTGDNESGVHYSRSIDGIFCILDIREKWVYNRLAHQPFINLEYSMI
jgi:hypothetical protein